MEEARLTIHSLQLLTRATSLLYTYISLPSTPHNKRILLSHTIKKYTQLISLKYKQIVHLFPVDDPSIPLVTAGDFTSYYDELKKIKMSSNNVKEDEEGELAEDVLEKVWCTEHEDNLDDEDVHVKKYLLLKKEIESLFSGEELFGRFLDLHSLHSIYLNLPNVKSSSDYKLPYLNFLSSCDKFHITGYYEVKGKETKAYKDYLEMFFQYLSGFIERAQPLFNIGALLYTVDEQFNSLWEKKEVPGWEWVWEKVESKVADSELFCAPCGKQFNNQNVYSSHLTGKKHLKAIKSNPGKAVEIDTINGIVSQEKSALIAQWKSVAIIEFFISKMMQSGVLGEVREETINHIDAMSLLTDKERQELIESIQQTEPSNIISADLITPETVQADDDSQVLYNPLKLPLGWDGKPIPFWLYKLHGLGVEYSCEICGGWVYLGRKAFDKHFGEYRHGVGMKNLGIPNIKRFWEVTSINDVIALFEQYKALCKKEMLKPEELEEYEDDEGNVFNKKTFEDLKRQGLI